MGLLTAEEDHGLDRFVSLDWRDWARVAFVAPAAATAVQGCSWGQPEDRPEGPAAGRQDNRAERGRQSAGLLTTELGASAEA